MNKILLVVMLFLVPVTAGAAPFCVVVQGIPPDCIYDDTTSCRQRAAQLAGVCLVNTKEITGSYGTDKFCTVDSSRVPQCIYVDRSSCESAQTNVSVCVNNNFININEEQQDPFASDPNRNY